MSRPIVIFLLGLLCFGSLYGQEPVSEAQFVPNRGQWPGDFAYKVRLASGALFFTDSGYTALLHQNVSEGGSHSHAHRSQHQSFQSIAYRMRWVSSQASIGQLMPSGELAFKNHYFLGNNPERWQTDVPAFSMLHHQAIYPGINVNYYSDKGRLKYDIEVAPGADPDQVLMDFTGVEACFIREKNLVLQTSLGEIEEWIPEAYQLINGQRVKVHCVYRITEAGVGFFVAGYDNRYPLVIDPVLDFSTFSGSYADNWGYTATYDKQGGFYGGGIARSDSFPTTTGALQGNFGGIVDVAINKFSPDGTQMEYATYLGGSRAETPHSIVINAQNELVILGNTGSADFPIKSNGYQTGYSPGPPINVSTLDYPNSDYPTGSNLFICKLNANGSQLAASTYLGGNISEGVNTEIYGNYGDYSRGEVVILSNGDVAITSSSRSTDLPFFTTGATLADSTQNAIVAVFNSGLSQLKWGQYYGGSNDETGYSVRTDGSDVFICGTTTSSDIITSGNAPQSQSAGGWDGYLAKFNGTTGQFIGATYTGSSGRDQAFLIDIDKQGKIYTFGQGSGSMQASPGHYSNAGSHQFLQKYSNNLGTLEWSTVIGSGQAKSDLIPTAFMVDQCFNIYLSGWNGYSNAEAPSFSQANTHGLPVTPDAFQATTDGSDFYFMVLSRDAQNLLFGSYFGGTSHEHVDGGTSRFSPKGIVYQAACAGCSGGDFPTTPASYSPGKPTINCNFGAIKIDFQQTVRSLPDVDFDVDVDTVCNNLEVTFTNNSLNANQFSWDFGNGLTSTQSTPSTVYSTFGSYTVTLVATDTVCDISDTNTVEINHQKGVEPKAAFEIDYMGCDNTYEARFTNLSQNAQEFVWLFGDGSQSSKPEPVHLFPDSGSYNIILLAYDSLCNQVDTSFGKIHFKDTTEAPTGQVWHPECGNGKLQVKLSGTRDRYQYNWEYPGGTATGPTPDITLSQKGQQIVNLEVYDTQCKKTYDLSFKVFINDLMYKIFIPNAFTPNNDGLNDHFMLTGDECSDSSTLRIFNRWGQTVFITDKPFEEFWDGNFAGQPAPQGVYTYVLKTAENEKKDHLTLLR